MRILIDGDGCPKPVKEFCNEISLKENIQLFFYTTLAHVGKNHQRDCIILDTQLQSVDIKIANDAKADDIVVTQDYGLASMVLPKRSHPIGVRGEIFTRENIDSYLLIRHENFKLRKSGILRGGPAKYNKQDIMAFSKNLTNLVEKIKKN